MKHNAVTAKFISMQLKLSNNMQKFEPQLKKTQKKFDSKFQIYSYFHLQHTKFRKKKKHNQFINIAWHYLIFFRHQKKIIKNIDCYHFPMQVGQFAKNIVKQQRTSWNWTVKSTWILSNEEITKLPNTHISQKLSNLHKKNVSQSSNNNQWSMVKE